MTTYLDISITTINQETIQESDNERLTIKMIGKPYLIIQLLI